MNSEKKNIIRQNEEYLYKSLLKKEMINKLNEKAVSNLEIFKRVIKSYLAEDDDKAKKKK